MHWWEKRRMEEWKPIAVLQEGGMKWLGSEWQQRNRGVDPERAGHDTHWIWDGRVRKWQWWKFPILLFCCVALNRQGSWQGKRQWFMGFRAWGKLNPISHVIPLKRQNGIYMKNFNSQMKVKFSNAGENKLPSYILWSLLHHLILLFTSFYITNMVL